MKSVSFFGLLTIVFITLKLTNFISWEWWVVFSPLLLRITIWLVIVVFSAFVAFKTDKV